MVFCENLNKNPQICNSFFTKPQKCSYIGNFNKKIIAINTY